MNKTALIWSSILCLILPILLAGFAFKIQQVYGQSTVYIRVDGSVEPETAPISTFDNITYILTGNINEPIVLERNNIILDGAGYVVDGSGLGRGLNLNNIHNITIREIQIEEFYYGIHLNLTSHITITESNVTMNAYDGIRMVQSLQSNISRNRISNNGNDGVKLLNSSSNNVIAENTITMNNDDGIQLNDCLQNTISGNNISQNQDIGVYALNSSATIAIGNTVMNNRHGMEIASSFSNEIVGNTFNGNDLYGIWLSSSPDNIVNENILNNNNDGIYSYQSSGNFFSANEIHGNVEYGIWLDFSSNNTVDLNNITENSEIGVYVRYSSVNFISDNTISNSNTGISLSGSSNNFILRNLVANSNSGIILSFSSTNDQIYHNNFVNNTQQASSTSTVTWENGLEGNYWSDYFGIDLDLDGIGDSPYIINAGNDDNFPLMGMFYRFDTPLGHYVNVISNSTVDDFNYVKLPGDISIIMHVSNMTPLQTAGLCRVTIPHALLTEPYNVTINGAQPNYANYTIYDNTTHRWIYFNYNHSTLEVVIQGIETTPPEISIISPENMTYAATDVSLVFTLDETTSWMGYSLDGQANVTIGGNTTLIGLSEGPHNVIVFANDTFGNMGASGTVNFTVDTISPTIGIISPENITYSTSPIMLTYTVSEPTSWIGYSLNGQANVTVLGNTTLPGLPDGSHFIVVYANDTSGNMGASGTVNFTVAIPPAITIMSPGNMTYATSDLSLTFTIDEVASWIGYSLDGQANVTIFGNTTLLGLSDSVHNVMVYANDTFGNMAASNMVYFSVDTTPPTITIFSPLNQTYQTSSTMLNFTLDEATSWIGYSLDDQFNMTILGNTTLLDIPDGNHHVIIYAIDAFGNTGSSTMVYFSVDTTPPDITYVSQYPLEDNVLPDDMVRVNATVTDNFSGIKMVMLNYTTNNGTWFSVEMFHLMGDIWNATIPEFPYCTTVNYSILAEDNIGNTITTEELIYTLQYHVISEFISYIALLLLMITTLAVFAISGKKRIKL